MSGDPIRTTLRVAEIFEDLDIPYYVAGSVAGNILGEVRATKDVDFVADLRRATHRTAFRGDEGRV